MLKLLSNLLVKRKRGILVVIQAESVLCTLCKNEGVIIGEGYDYEFQTSSDLWKTKFCERCDHFFLDPRPRISSAEQIYPDNYYPPINRKHLNQRFIMFMRYLFEKKRYKKLAYYLGQNPCIVDIGAGDGRVLGFLRKIYGKQIRLIAIDLAFPDETKRFFKKNKIEFFEGVLEKINLSKYVPPSDVVIMTQVIEHLWNPDKVIKDINSILKPKGVIFVETPNPNCFCRKIQGDKYWGGVA